MLTPETISDDLDKYKENVSKVIDKARKNHDFALAVLEEKTLSELDLSKEEQVALFKACSMHRSREIQRRIILNQGLCEFATQHRLHAFFFPITKQRARSVNNSPKSGKRKYSPPTHSQSVPTSPKHIKRPFKSAVEHLRAALHDCSCFYLRHSSRTQIKEDKQPYMYVFSVLWYINSELDNLHLMCLLIRSLLEAVNLGKLKHNCTMIQHYIDHIKLDVHIEIGPNDQADNPVLTEQYEENLAAVNEMKQIFDVAHKYNKKHPLVEHFNSPQWRVINHKIQSFIASNLHVFTRYHAAGELAETLVTMRLYIAALEMQKYIMSEEKITHRESKALNRYAEKARSPY